jgi:hypothetical protein
LATPILSADGLTASSKKSPQNQPIHFPIPIPPAISMPCSLARTIPGERPGELHLAGVTANGRLWHTIRRSDGWTEFVDVERQAGDRGAFRTVSVSLAKNRAGGIELHLSGVTANGRLWHTIRRSDGSWTEFGDVEGQAGDRGAFVTVGIAGLADELHLSGVTADGRLWHTIRRSDGSWFGFGDVEGQAGDRGAFVTVGIAGVLPPIL